MALLFFRIISPLLLEKSKGEKMKEKAKRYEYLTAEVLKYNKMEEGDEKQKFEKELLDKIDPLLYEIPIDECYIDFENVAEFYLSEHDRLLSMIKSYVICKLSFYNYLCQILRKRASMFIIRKSRKDNNIFKCVCYADIDFPFSENHSDWKKIYSENDNDDYDDILNKIEKEESEDLFFLTGAYDNFTLKELSEHIIMVKEYKKERSLSKKEEKIRTALEKRKTRKDFLCLLLYVPSNMIIHNSLEISNVLSIDEEAVLRLFILKDGILRPKQKNANHLRSLMIKYYRLMLTANIERNSSSDEKEKKTLYKKEERYKRFYNKYFSKTKKYYKGLSQGEIAKILMKSRASVCHSIKSIVSLLNTICDENDIIQA